MQIETMSNHLLVTMKMNSRGKLVKKLILVVRAGLVVAFDLFFSSMQYYKCNQFPQNESKLRLALLCSTFVHMSFICTTLKFTHQKPYIPQSAGRSKFTISLHVIFSLDTKGMILINVIKIAAARIIAN